MHRFITYSLILCFVSPCLSTRWTVQTNNGVFNVMDYGARGDGETDDSNAFSSAWSNACKASGMSTLVIPSGKTFLVTIINFVGPCNAKVLIQFEGQIVAPSKKAWKDNVQYLINIEHVNGLTINGNDQGGINGDGSTWWQCSSCQRPAMIHFHACNDLSVSNMKISNSPRAHVSINMCNGATFSHVSIDSPATSPNTDGFDISDSTNILVQDSNIKSGDDCIAVNGGCSFINATRVTCGPGHGISVGSLGRNNGQDTVSDVYVLNCTFAQTQNGARIKTVPGGSGYAKRINFEQIILDHVKNPIIIDQEYNNTSEFKAVSVSAVTYQGFTGTSASEIAINLDCSSSGCFDIVLNNINIVSAIQGKEISASCRNAHGSATNTIPNVSCLRN